MTYTILVACSANVCRSPLVAAVLTRSVALEEVGLRIEIETGGLDVVVDDPVCPDIVKLADARRLRSSGLVQHHAKALTIEQVEGASLIITADRRVRSGIVKRAPQAAARTFTLREAAQLADQAVLLLQGAGVDDRLREFTDEMNSRRGFTDLPRTRRVLALSAPWRLTPVHAHDVPDAHQDERAPHRVVYHSVVGATEQLAHGLAACAPTRTG